MKEKENIARKQLLDQERQLRNDRNAACERRRIAATPQEWVAAQDEVRALDAKIDKVLEDQARVWWG